MAPEIERITNTFLQGPARVEVARQATASETIDQFVALFKPSRRDRADSEKRRTLRALIEAEGEKLTNAIVFCNRKVDVDIVAKSLKKYGLDAAPIHGDLDQSVRTRTLDGFRKGELKLLVASDVAARGLDVPSVSHVFNYDVPSHAEDYVHRIGRTGRAGREGRAITICGPRDDKNLEDVERLLQKQIPRMADPAAPAADVETPEAAEVEEAPKPKRTRNRRSDKKADPKPEPKADQAVEQTVEQSADEPRPDPKPEGGARGGDCAGPWR